jgi:hypothetical protein
VIKRRSRDHSFLDSSSLLSDLLERLEGETPLTIDPGTTHGRTTPPSPSIYNNNLGETETFFRDSSSSSTQDSRALLPGVKLPGRTLSQSYRQVIDDFPADECPNDSDIPAQLLEIIPQSHQHGFPACENITQANSSSVQDSEGEKTTHRRSIGNRPRPQSTHRSFSSLISLRRSPTNQGLQIGVTRRFKTRISRFFRKFRSGPS